MFKTLRSRVNVKKRERSAKSQLPSFSITFFSLVHQVQKIVSFAGLDQTHLCFFSFPFGIFFHSNQVWLTFLHSLLTHSRHKGDLTSSKTFFLPNGWDHRRRSSCLFSRGLSFHQHDLFFFSLPSPPSQKNSVPTQKTAGKRQQCGLQKISQLNLVWLTQNNHWRICPTWSQFLVLAAFSWFSLHYLCQ